ASAIALGMSDKAREYFAGQLPRTLKNGALSSEGQAREAPAEASSEGSQVATTWAQTLPEEMGSWSHVALLSRCSSSSESPASSPPKPGDQSGCNRAVRVLLPVGNYRPEKLAGPAEDTASGGTGGWGLAATAASPCQGGLSRQVNPPQPAVTRPPQKQAGAQLICLYLRFTCASGLQAVVSESPGDLAPPTLRSPLTSKILLASAALRIMPVLGSLRTRLRDWLLLTEPFSVALPLSERPTPPEPAWPKLWLWEKPVTSPRSRPGLRFRGSLLVAAPVLFLLCSQAARAKTASQRMSDPSDTFHKPCGQTGPQNVHTQLMETTLFLKQASEEHPRQQTRRPAQQELVLGEQGHAQDAGEQEALASRSMCQVVRPLQSGASGQPSPSRDAGGDVGAEQQAQPSGQPDQPAHQLSGCEAAFVTPLSDRGADISTLFHSRFQDYKSYQEDKYHKDKNSSLSQTDMNYIEESLLQYSDWRGQPFLREEAARFLAYYCKAPSQLDPENVVVLNGCCSVFSALAMVLCNPGEAFLTPTPFYGGFVFTTSLYSKVELIHVYLDSEVLDGKMPPFQLTVGKLEQALLDAQLKGKKVRGLLLINPQNPLGDVYSRESLKEYLEFAKRYSLHVIIDEIFMLSVFDESITFHSVLSIESLPDPDRTHMIWGPSKDFGISGFRCGMLYTPNKEVASAVSAFGYLHSLSGITQYKLCQLLRDREWIDQVFLPTKRRRLKTAHRYITSKLQALKIPFLKCGAGLYIWISLKKFLNPCTFEEELLLHRRFLDNKLMLSRGQSYLCKEPGWFRLNFADRHLQTAMDRFCQVLEEQKLKGIEKLTEDAWERAEVGPCPFSGPSPGLMGQWEPDLARGGPGKPWLPPDAPAIPRYPPPRSEGVNCALKGRDRLDPPRTARCAGLQIPGGTISGKLTLDARSPGAERGAAGRLGGAIPALRGLRVQRQKCQPFRLSALTLPPPAPCEAAADQQRALARSYPRPPSCRRIPRPGRARARGGGLAASRLEPSCAPARRDPGAPPPPGPGLCLPTRPPSALPSCRRREDGGELWGGLKQFGEDPREDCVQHVEPRESWLFGWSPLRALSDCVFQMFTRPQKEAGAPPTCLGPASTQNPDDNNGDGLERECPRKPEQKLPGRYGVGDPSAMFSGSSQLSSRGGVIKWFWDSAEEGYRTYHMDEYDEEKNPSGIINLGTSENKLCFDLLSRRLSLSDMLRVEPALLQYPDWRGHLFLREEVAKFLSFYCKSPAALKPENVVVLNGCASLFSALATVLCEVGEAFLIPAPYYGAITQHVYLYGNVRLVCVYLDSEGVKVKGLILINPHNPLGDVYSPGELREFLEFAKRHELHVMVDEVYMLSVFEESVGYHSVLSLERLPDPQKTHVMWATSKDFGMSGLRFGTLYTENRDVATAVASLCRYHGLSGLVQYQMAQLLRDHEWISQVYLPENHARLKAAHTYMSEELGALGIPFLSRGAGFFIWVDLRQYLRESTFEEEMLLWRRFLDNKVLLSFGKAFECPEPGWFRLVFSDKAHRLRLGMQRIRQVLEGKSQVAKDAASCQTQEPGGRLRSPSHCPLELCGASKIGEDELFARKMPGSASTLKE
ncbi:1-aminocyclopropane-1-carboxylate synthase-like protein 1, partial [Galemys pyrenaicus]